MREAIEMIVRALVDNPDAVDIHEIERSGTTMIEVRVAQEDIGKIIGKQGRTIRALRSVAKVVGGKTNRRYVVEIVE